MISRNLGKLQDADGYINEALRHLDGMTERERFATRGFQFRLTGDYQQCAKEFGDLIARFSGDAIAYNQRALCSSKLRNLARRSRRCGGRVKILPNHTMFRGNLALYATYAGDFPTAEQEARAIEQPSDLAPLALAFAQVGQGQLPAAADTYQKLSAMSARGASWAASGLADLALFEGRFSEAARFFEQGAAADLAAKCADRAARKLTSLAYAQLMQGRPAPAIAAAERPWPTARRRKSVPCGALLVEAGALDSARERCRDPRRRAPGRASGLREDLEGQIALKNGDARAAIKILTEANDVLDTWMGHFELGRAYLEAARSRRPTPSSTAASSDAARRCRCSIDEEPTYGYLPPVYYYQGRVREGLKNARFAESYREYLKIRGKSTEDPLLPEIRKRAGASR